MNRQHFFQEHEITPLPIIIETLNFPCNRDELYRQIIQQHREYPYNYGSNLNFPIRDNDHGDFNRLYTLFLDKVQRHISNIKLSNRNSRHCWIYVTNKDRNGELMHNHTRTATINGVYYFTTSMVDDYNDGVLEFYNHPEDKDCVFRYKPRVGDLLIFPGWLWHKPLATFGEQYRIAINMEIILDE